MESQPPPAPTDPNAGMSGAPPQQQMPTVDDVYAQAPPQLQQEIDLMREQGMPDEQIMQTLMQLLQQQQ
ncbi:hypothetical protein D3C77_771240 [compost metagenome]